MRRQVNQRHCESFVTAGLMTVRLVVCWFALIVPLKVTVAAEPLTPRNLAGSYGRVALGADAFALPRSGLTGSLLEEFFEGHRLFNVAWVTAPSAVVETDGLGPVFNRVGCGRCHEGNGRGRPPGGPADPLTSAVLRLGLVSDGKSRPDPVYGVQLQSRSIPGVRPEGYGVVRWRIIQGAYSDGMSYSLRAPVLSVRAPNYGPLAPGIRLSMRVASPVFGIGALARVPDKQLRALADPDDRNSDGISGRLAVLKAAGAKSERKPVIGRFGWKAAQPSVRAQTSSAFSQDMGLTTRLFPQRVCPTGGARCRSAPAGGQPEVSPETMARILHYMNNLAVPFRRNVDQADVKRGDRLFRRIGCAACHAPSLSMVNGDGVTETIHPFTDLLLHDMGPGLSDGLPESAARAGEWRTPPLWGIGLSARVNGQGSYLHDGRARSLVEAILWHGGEAARAQENFRGLSKADRDALIAFLKSL